MKGLRKKLSLTTPDLVLLAVLREKPMHGYELHQELMRREAQDWVSISKPQIYYSLEKLARTRHIVHHGEVHSDQGPDKKSYKITKLGINDLCDSISRETWVKTRVPQPFQTWLALSPNLPRHTALQLLGQRMEFASGELDKERTTLQAIQRDTGAMVEVAHHMVRFAIVQLEAELRWLSEIKAAWSTK